MYVVCALKYEFMQPDMYTWNGTLRENLLIYLVCMYIYVYVCMYVCICVGTMHKLYEMKTKYM